MADPHAWPSRPLGSFSELKGGKRLPKGETFAKTKTAYPYIRVTDFKNYGVDVAGVKYLRADTQAAISRYIITKCDIYISIAGTIGVVGMVPKDLDAANLTENAARIVISDTDAVLPHYLMFFLASEPAQKYLNSQTVKNAQPKLALVRIKAIPVPVPPVEEQRQIARVLLTVQRAIDRQERLIALTAELKKALMHRLFTEGTRSEPLKQTEVGPMPESWRTEPLDQHLSAAQYGLSAKGTDDGKTPILRMTNQVDGRVVANDLQTVNISDDDRAKFKVKPLDILFNRTNSFELVGRTAIFDLPGEYVFASYLIRLRTCPDTLRARFLNHYLNWDATQARLKGIASRAVSQSNISASRLRGFVVPLPSPEEQDEIIRCMDEIDRVRALRLRSLTIFEELFRSLLHQLMTAQVRVHDLEWPALEPAGVM